MDINKLCPGCMKEIEGRESAAVCPNCGFGLKNHKVEPHQLKPFTILAEKYLVGKVIGEGGVGISYLGFDLNHEIAVTIKEFYPDGFVTRESGVTTAVTVCAGKNESDVSKWRDGFISEARSLAEISDLSGIVEVKDFFNENGTAYIVTEYIDGITLKQYLKNKGGKISSDKVFQMMEPVARSLSRMHEAGMLHGDIDPDNIMMTKSGVMKLLDFGAMREFAGGGESIMLKPGYTPEEQYRSSGGTGPWSDVYALAATIYKCITGVTPIESMERLREDTLKWPSELGMAIDGDHEIALKQGMSVHAENRFQSMGAFYNALYPDEEIQLHTDNVFYPDEKTQLHTDNALSTDEKTQVQTVAEDTPQPKLQLQKMPAQNVAAGLNNQSAGLNQSVPKAPDGKKNMAAIVAAAAVALGAIVLFATVGPKLMGSKSKKADTQAVSNSEGKTTEKTETAEKTDEENTPVNAEPAVTEEETPDNINITAQVDEISGTVSEGSSAEELSGALDKFLELAKVHKNKDNLGEQVFKIYGIYQGKMLERINNCNGQEPSAALYAQISGDLDSSLGYAEQFKNYDIGVNSDELQAADENIRRGYKNRLVLLFDEYAATEIATNGVVSRSELWSKMDGVKETDMYDKENPNDPLRCRYAAALTLYTDSELEKLGNDGKIQRIYEVIVDADYSPYLIYRLKELGDPRAAKWYEYYCSYQDGNLLMEDRSEAELRNYVYYYYTNRELDSMREEFRHYMAGELE